jgi:hypothetical protein
MSTYSLDTLKQGLALLEGASLEELRSESFLIGVLRTVGLSQDSVRNQGGNEQWQVAGTAKEGPVLGGINQTPEQYAPALIELSKQQIKTVVDVGSWSGWNAAFLCVYLRRFEPSVKITSIDRQASWNSVSKDDELKSLPIEWIILDTLKDRLPETLTQGFDLAFIDAGHEKGEVDKDWKNFGEKSRCVFFHDVNDEPLDKRYAGKGLQTSGHHWRELQVDGKQKLEFFQHPSNKALMGIGLLIPIDQPGEGQ